MAFNGWKYLKACSYIMVYVLLLLTSFQTTIVLPKELKISDDERWSCVT